MKRVIPLLFLLYLVNPTSYSQTWVNNIPPSGAAITTITFDEQGNKWCGTLGSGIYKFNGSSWAQFTSANSALVNNTIFCSATDLQGNLWFGTANGVATYNGIEWTIYTIQNSGILGPRVNAIAVDVNNNRWFATSSGISKFDGITFTNYTSANSGLIGDNVRTVAIDAEGKKWFGSNGISMFDDNNWVQLTTANSNLPSNTITAIAFDSQGNKWFGTNVGFSRLNGSVLNSFFINGGVTSITIDNDDNKWLGTYNGVLLYHSLSEDWVTYTTSNSGIGGNTIYDITLGPACETWFSTGGGASLLTLCLELNENDTKTFGLFPNPTSGLFTVEFDGDYADTYMVSIYGLHGNQVFNQISNSSQSVIDIRHLQPGLYFIKISSDSGEIIKRIVKY